MEEASLWARGAGEGAAARGARAADWGAASEDFDDVLIVVVVDIVACLSWWVGFSGREWNRVRDRIEDRT